MGMVGHRPAALAMAALAMAALAMAALAMAALAMVAALLVPAPAGADPKPAAPDQTLKQLEHDLSAGRNRQTRLDRESATLKATLEALRARLVVASDAASRQQATLSQLEATLTSLEAEEQQQSADLAAHRRDLSRLIGALYRLSLTPPEALIVRPEAPVDAVRTALLLRQALPALHDRTEALARVLDRLQDLRRRLNAQRDEAEATRTALAARLAEVGQMVEEREALARETEAERQRNSQKMTQLAAQATDLRQLLEQIEADHRAEAERSAGVPPGPAGSGAPGPEPRQSARSEPPPAAAAAGPGPAPDAHGDGSGLRLPAAGRIALAYGAVDRFGLTSRGLHIACEPGTPVVAPLDGTIRFAGRFRNYGQILIVEHSNGYHSLIAGLGRIDTAVGRSVSAGEPVGVVADPADGVPDLYFELRRNGQPINPRRGIPALDGKGQG
jgi:septal ring factor EnvC (AmiA/AmiB activator)